MSALQLVVLLFACVCVRWLSMYIRMFAELYILRYVLRRHLLVFVTVKVADLPLFTLC